MNFLKNTIILLIVLAGGFYFLFLNLGKILDITSSPSKVDLLVCLGGGDHKKRVEKTIELYQKEYLEKDSLIFTGIQALGSSTYKDFDKKTNIIIVNSVKNTMEEVLYIKKYIKENHLSSVGFITEAPHSRRIKIFWDNFGEEMNNVGFSIIASELKTWDSENYYKDKFSRQYAYSEVVKLIYNFFVYGVLEKLGLKEEFENNFKQELKEGKREILKPFR